MPDTTSLSSTWAVREALHLRQLGDISEATLFGLGASAWYQLQDAAGGAPLLRAYHPDRIKQSFYGLNVFAVRFNYLSDDVRVHLSGRSRLGAQTLIAVDRFALPAGLLGSDDGLPPGIFASLDYTLLVHAEAGRDGAASFLVQGPRTPQPVSISQAQLDRAWFQQHGSASTTPTATLYWHPSLQLNWDAPQAMHAALQRHAARMLHTYPTLGPTGLGALEELLLRVRSSCGATMQAAAHCALADGGLALCRDMQAAFTRSAAQVLGRPELGQAAKHFADCGHAWRALFERVLEGSAGASTLRAGLQGIVHHERSAALLIGDALEQAARKGSSCHM